MSGAELAMFLAIDARVAAEVDDLRRRLTEVEERLDFAERLLSHGGPSNQLTGGARP